MKEELSRTKNMLGDSAIKKLQNSKVIIFGLGGVGSYTFEALVRSGIGEIDIVDCDKVAKSNINRQLIALQSTIGEDKVEVAKKRALDINPNIQIETFNFFFSEETKDKIDFSKYDYIIDAIDSVKSKLLLIEIAKENNISIICSMGTGNKLDPTKFEIADISKTSVCPLARVMRQELKKRNIKNIKVLFSKEEPIKPIEGTTPSSNSFVPATAGLLIASFVVKELII